ncbi:MAG: TldD/PmbA family protein [Silvanigrellaceae bacterium]
MNANAGVVFEQELKENFSFFNQSLFSSLAAGEHARSSLTAEQSQFTRMSRGCIRQNGFVEDAMVTVQFISATHSTTWISRPFVVDSKDRAVELVQNMLAEARRQAGGAPQDPYVSIPKHSSRSHVSHAGAVPSSSEIVENLLSNLKKEDDLVGFYAGGKTISALADSAGTDHWFSSDSFFVDYSLWLPNGRAIKSGYAGREWNQSEFLRTLAAARKNLQILERPVRTLKPGSHRVFLAPSATSELLNMFSWGAVSEGALQRNESPLCHVRRGEKSFSPLFSLRENYGLGFAPRFSGDGELAPEELDIFKNGDFVQALCSERTAREYGVSGNGSSSESLRTPEMGVGELATDGALAALGTGLYLSDLHYLNWSDMIQGRVTGMTRYGCVWVENGVPVGPIRDMRFDETIFRCFGSKLEAVTREAQIIPETSTYGKRAMGGARVPGVLINQFEFTL